ncbi:flagellar hook-associated protein FlgL [Delftia sp. PS-11]|uniref:flagellar hook-associated protein FlgL n=1 Tax=Delftia sp. PS-11 TaxID=2767222 RepID=UPI002458D563|nr:flagellar hook-associated protein FlgL [Delftia sp. PS-11]KAJ8746247.1 flagellar hook-associated protein FlgL [Delftia sp. PS-11]
MSSYARIGTANMYDSTVRNLSSRQSNLVDLMEKTTSGKRVVRASDDPVAAAQAERAQTRLTRASTDQRALDAQRNIMSYTESTLGESVSALQEFRDQLVSAGNGTYDQTSRDALLARMTSLRDQLMTYANRKDTNGLPLFRGLDSAEQPIQGYNFAGQAGQAGSNDSSIPNTIDGAAAWMNVPTGNGVYQVSLGNAGGGKFWTDVGTITNPTAAAAATLPLTVAFSTDASGNLQYSADGGTTQTPFKSGDAITVQGMRVTVSGTPKTGDSFTLNQSTRSDLFSVMDRAIDAVRNGANADGSTASSLTQAIGRGLTEIDAGMSRLQTAQGLAGDMLNRADRIEDGIKDREVQLEADRSRAEDIDMIKALSDVDMQKVGLQAALQSYASIQKLSLFNFIN